MLLYLTVYLIESKPWPLSTVLILFCGKTVAKMDIWVFTGVTAYNHPSLIILNTVVNTSCSVPDGL